MKVAYVSYSYPNVSYGGASISSFKLVKELANLVDISVYIPIIRLYKLSNWKSNAKIIPVRILPFRELKSPSFIYYVSKKINRKE